MNKLLLSWLIVLFSTNALGVDHYYKCRDPNGRIRYTDRQCYAIGSVEVGGKKNVVAKNNANQEPPKGNSKPVASETSLDKEVLPKNQAIANPEKTPILEFDPPNKSVWQGVLDKITSLFSFGKLEAGASDVSSSQGNNFNQKSVYTCKGKIRCSEMTSCDEAKFYLKNCPNVKIDGDKNGVPCEKQWCN